MTPKSLRSRLALAACASILSALLLSWFVLVKVFERHVDTGFERELDNHLRHISAMIEPDGAGGLRIAGQLADPRFELPFSGLYWQVLEGSGVVASSHSLADEILPVSLAAPTGEQPICVDVPGPRGRLVILVVRALTVRMGGREHELKLAAAMDQSEVTQAVSAFQRDLGLSLAVLGGCLMAAAWGQISIGLAPLGTLRLRLAEVRQGGHEQLAGKHPDEVQGLVDDLNAMLTHQAKSLVRARARAGDLAHGLKTPLMALNTIVRELKDKGDVSTATEIAALVGRMQQHVNREIVRTQIIGEHPQGSRTPLREVIEQLVETMRRLPRGNEIDWSIEIDPASRVGIERGDLQELAGNLLENAVHWTKSRIRVTDDGPTCTHLLIEDDGPGVPETDLSVVLARGESRSNGANNAGLGLAIVGDIAEAYGYVVELFRSPLGGLGVRIALSKDIDQLRPANDAGQRDENSAAS